MKIGIKTIEDRIMKKSFIFFAASLLALAGCSRNQEIDIQENGLSLFAKTESPADTKTVVESGVHVYWEPGDEIAVFMGEKSAKFATDITAASGTATFKGTFGDLSWPEVFDLWAVYPFSEDATFDGETITTVLPSEQIAREGSFGKDTNLAIAHSNSSTLQFYNVGGGVRFSLTREGVKEVVFQGQNDEIIAGKIKIAFTDGIPAIKEVVEGQRAITLTAPNGGTFDTGKWYYIVALPGTLTGGFKMTFSTGTQSATLNSSGSKTIKRGIFGSQADADEDLIYKDKGDEPNPDDVILFEDPVAKYACVEKFDTNGDGEVSYAEAAAVTTLSGLFNDWNTVTSFEEIRYFTSVTSTQNVFTGLTKLTHITIPDNISTLGTFKSCTALETVVLPASLNALPASCFDGCSSLKSVTLPTGITSIPNYAFRNCAVLETISMPSTIKSVGQYAFSRCSVLTGIDLPLGFQTIGEYAFEQCNAITSVDFPSTLASIGPYAYASCTALTSVTVGSGVSVGEGAFCLCDALGSATIGIGGSVGKYAFSACSSLVSVILPEDMTSIPAYCFQNCTKLTTITWPNALTTIGNGAFAGCRFEDSDYTLQLPPSVTNIGSNAFGALRHLILPSTATISITSNSFTVGYTVLYVPANMVEMYKVRTNWSNYATRIRPISDYPASIAVEAVDLGLSVKWASCNVGAWGAIDFGDYFAWGETDPYYNSLDPLTWKEGKTGYNWASYKWCNGSKNTLTKYCNDSSYGYNKYTDTKTVLDPEDDAAHVNLGGNWRMPTEYEFTQLRSECTWKWTTMNGVNGYLVTGSNGNSIFLPAAGYGNGTKIVSVDSFGGYWTSSLNTLGPSTAWSETIRSGNVGGPSEIRIFGYSIRPVCTE